MADSGVREKRGAKKTGLPTVEEEARSVLRWSAQRLNRGVIFREAPAPSLPEEVVQRTQAKYLEAFHRLTGLDLSL